MGEGYSPSGYTTPSPSRKTYGSVTGYQMGGGNDPKNRPAASPDVYAPVETYAAASKAPVAFTVNHTS